MVFETESQGFVYEPADKRQAELLKAENALEWVGKMNNIRACARKVVEKEIVYC